MKPLENNMERKFAGRYRRCWVLSSKTIDNRATNFILPITLNRCVRNLFPPVLFDLHAEAGEVLFRFLTRIYEYSSKSTYQTFPTTKIPIFTEL